MKHPSGLAGFMALALAITAIVSGCATQHTPSTTGTSTTTATAAPSAASTVSLPASVTGTINGKTVTLQTVIQTDIAIDTAYCRPFQNGFAIILLKEKLNGSEYAYVDKDGKLLGNTAYTFAQPFDSNGRALVQKADNTWVYIDTTGKEVGAGVAPVSQETDLSMYYEEGGLFGLLDDSGKHLTEASYEQPGGFTDGLAFVSLVKGEHKKVLIDRQGTVKVVLSDDCKNADVDGDYIWCSYAGNDTDSDRRCQLLNRSGNILNANRFKAIGGFCDGLAPVILDGKLGLMDEKGTLVIEPSLSVDDNDQIDLGIGENRIVVSQNGKMTIVDLRYS